LVEELMIEEFLTNKYPQMTSMIIRAT